MAQYILRRLVLIVPTFLVVSVLVFAMLRLIPGDVIDIMSQGDPNRATADALRVELGLDRPAPYQYLVWLSNILQGDLGHSLYTKKPVTDELAWRVPVTLEMAFLALTIALLIAAPIAVVSAVQAGQGRGLRAADRRHRGCGGPVFLDRHAVPSPSRPSCGDGRRR